MEEEGREVAEMGGLHIIGTERHEARRIDNQLRGRAGRQGDPGSGRFYLSLQDDLMRIFAGEWVAGVLQRLGMEQGQAIESKMVSRRIEAAQKKVEEHNFDIRKNLLEYDEVMDHQRKRVYGYRQEILNGANCKIRILDMIEEQVECRPGPLSGRHLRAGQFRRARLAEAGHRVQRHRLRALQLPGSRLRPPATKASNMIQTQIQEAMDENLGSDIDPKEWNWRRMAGRVNSLWGLKTTDRQLKQIGRDNLAGFIIEQAEKAIARDRPDQGSTVPGAGLGQAVPVRMDSSSNSRSASRSSRSRTWPGNPLADRCLLEEIRELYRQKEIEFPITVAMARFMSDATRQMAGPGAALRSRRALAAGIRHASRRGTGHH